MEILSRIVLQLLFGALLLWLSIKIVDRHNYKNSLPAAFGWSLIIGGAGFFPFLMGLAMFLVVFSMICVRYYELGILATIAVLLVQIGLSIGLGFVLSAIGLAAGGVAA